MAATSDEEIKTRLREAATDPRAQEARLALSQTVQETLARVGQELAVGGYIVGPGRVDGTSKFGFGSDATVGLATVALVAGELVDGALQLLRAGNLYAAAALMRQLVETEYLGWAFAEDPEEAGRWLGSTHDERLKMWQPRHLRQQSGGRFRARDYGGHCERGGHPTPEARRLVRGWSDGEWIDLWRYDLTVHAVSTWKYVDEAATSLGRPVKPPGAWEETLPTMIQTWETSDPLPAVIGLLPRSDLIM